MLHNVSWSKFIWLSLILQAAFSWCPVKYHMPSGKATPWTWVIYEDTNNGVFNHFPACVESLLCYESILWFNPRAKPVFRPERPVPYSALSNVDEELNRFQLQEVITLVSYSAWTVPIMVIITSELLLTHYGPFMSIFVTVNTGF